LWIRKRYNIKKNRKESKDVKEQKKDFKLIDMGVEYEYDAGVPKDERKIAFICCEIEIADPKTGERYRLFKAIKLMRVLSVPQAVECCNSLDVAFADLLSTCYEFSHNLISIVVNIIDPVPLGVLHFFGVQATGLTEDEAKEKCKRNYLELAGTLKATYRDIHSVHIRDVSSKEWKSIRNKMCGMPNLAMLRGVPDSSTKGRELEKIALGMTDCEYVIQVISTPVFKEILANWDTKKHKDMTDERSKHALRGNGAFYTYGYIATENEEGLTTAKTLVKQSAHNQTALEPVQILELTENEQRKLRNRFCVFSTDVTRDIEGDTSKYKYATILLPDEYVAYTHLPLLIQG